MTDHVTALSRLAQYKPVVCFATPSWTFELLLSAFVVACIAFCFVLGQLAIALSERNRSDEIAGRWMAIALQEEPVDTAASVRLEPDGVGFKCSHYNIRREWEAAVAAQCQTLAGLLKVARTAP